MASLEQTRAYLHRHHGSAEDVVQRTRATFAERHGADFWAFWHSHVQPAFTARATPVVVDFGTGEGLFLQELASRYPTARLFGVECAEYMLALTPTAPARWQRIVDDLHHPHLPLADGEVDVVIASLVLHELEQPMLALREAARILRLGGRLCIIDLTRGPLQTYLEKRYSAEFGKFSAAQDPDALANVFNHFQEHNRFTEDDWRFLIEANGFHILAQQSPRPALLWLAAERLTA